MRPEVSIVIPTFNHLEDCLKPCLASIIQHTDLTKAEVIVVANGCTDGTEDYVRSLKNPSIRLIHFADPQGYTRSTNAGIQNATGDYVVLLNNDNVLLGQPFNQWIEYLKQPFLDPKMAISGVTKIWDKYTKYSFIIFFCAMIKRDIFTRIGLLDETFNPGGGEDIDFSIRVQKAGYRIAATPATNEQEVWSYATPFPIYHRAEATVHGEGLNFNWQTVFSKNMNLLERRYRKPITHSLLIAASSNVEDLKRCIKSIYEYTDYTDLEIIIAIDKHNQSLYEYFKKIEPYGPYDYVLTDGQLAENDAFKVALDRAYGENIVFVSGRLQFLHQDKNQWLNMLLTPFDDPTVGLTAFVADKNSVSTWGAMIKKHWIAQIQIPISSDMPKNLATAGKRTIGLAGRISYLPIFYPG